MTKYMLHGKNIVHMTQGSDELHFFYDAQNKPAVVVYNGVPYSYVKNLQGDVVALLNSTGAVVVSYVYDAWGRPISKVGSMASTLGTVQPFRYRSYVFDEETELYYLRSRCFSSVLCRFISSDGLIDRNLYAYCDCSPLYSVDPDGTETIQLRKQRKKVSEISVSDIDEINNISALDCATLLYYQLNKIDYVDFSLSASQEPERSFYSSSGTHNLLKAGAYPIFDFISVCSGEIGDGVDCIWPGLGQYVRAGIDVASKVFLPDTAPATYKYTEFTVKTIYRNSVPGWRYADITQTFYNCALDSCSEHPSNTIHVTVTLCNDLMPGYGGNVWTSSFDYSPR